jgi:hypothetical protein
MADSRQLVSIATIAQPCVADGESALVLLLGVDAGP